MIKKRFRLVATSGIYVLAFVLFVVSLFMVNDIIKNSILKDKSVNDYVDDSVVKPQDNYIPVIANDIEIIKPYMDNTVSVYKDYYDYKADSKGQEDAIIYYGNTYMQNSGIDYRCDNAFDVVSILDGTVTKVEENEILGTTVEIRHNNDIISVYQGLGDVNVKKDDTVMQGQVIAKSGKSSIYNDVDNGLHFELSHQGMVVNPNEYFNKNLKDL